MKIEEYIEKIKEQLVLAGYAGKLINYKELQELHQEYGNQMTEAEFAQEVLELSYGNYGTVKNRGQRARILKVRGIKISEEEIEQIKEKLVTEGYAGKSINYEELQELHKTYGSQMPEADFAQEVLELSYGNYGSVKNTGTRAVILKGRVVKTSEEEIEQIKEQLVSAGYAKKLINYEELQELHQKYGSQMPEVDFAQEVLGISYERYKSVKHSKHRARILRGEINEEEIKQIKEKLRLDGYARKTIDYKELQELHRKYGSQMPEADFAQEVLELSYGNYGSVKNTGTRAVILKGRVVKTSEEEIEQIKEKLVSAGYARKTIDYKELQKLHKKYGSQMPEVDFAQEVLEISYSNYRSVKNRGTRAVILKGRAIKTRKEEIEQIKEKLVLAGYAGKSINYEELKELYKTYGNQMSEAEFAQRVLEIKYENYNSVKHIGTRARILKGRIKRTKEGEIERIKEELVSAGYAGRLIDYKELQKLHQKYGNQMQEEEFAQEILEIDHKSYKRIKNKAGKAKILKWKIEKKSKKKIKQIQEKLVSAGYAGKPINYEELQELHKTYGNQMKEADFAQEVLEISYANYNRVKNKGQRAKILCHDSQIKLIKSILLKESRWYTKEEIEKMCEENEISIDKFIEQILGNRTPRYNDIYRKLIEQKGKIWIGRTRVSEEFLKRYEEEILNLARRASNSIKSKFGKEFQSEYEDWKQEAIICFIENYGEIEKNFEDWREERKRLIYNTLRRYILYKVLGQTTKRERVVSLHQRFRLKNDEKELEGVIPSDYNLEEDIVQREHSNEGEEQFEGKELAEKCIEEMKRQIEAGLLGRNEILEHIERKYKISKGELLKIMQDYLMENGRVKVSTDGEVSWKDDSR